jgi:hypothetical protein
MGKAFWAFVIADLLVVAFLAYCLVELASGYSAGVEALAEDTIAWHNDIGVLPQDIPTVVAANTPSWLAKLCNYMVQGDVISSTTGNLYEAVSELNGQTEWYG